jgi:aminoglycoside 6'-N-acetyltransferase I
LQEENEGVLADGGQAVFLAERGGEAAGVAHCTVRREGAGGAGTCSLEGVYVAPGARKRGVATRLLALCEGFGREMGCDMFASDCDVGNEGSIAFHRKAGFTEARRIACFVKPL